jgi:hypothetical protein
VGMGEEWNWFSSVSLAGFDISDAESRGSPTRQLVGQSVRQVVAYSESSSNDALKLLWP